MTNDAYDHLKAYSPEIEPDDADQPDPGPPADAVPVYDIEDNQ